MSTAWHLEFHAAASSQIPGLPADAYVAMVQVLVAVARDPWSATFVDDPADPVWRWVPFAELGMVAVHVDKDRRVVRVHGVTWTG